MKTNLFPKLLLMAVICIVLNSCTADDQPEQNSPTISAEDQSQGGPVIPPGPKP